jgi:hypothetical protein
MKFGFKMGKNKEKDVIQEEASVEATDDSIPEIPLDAEPVAPHAPLQELTLENENGANNGETPLVEGETAGEENSEPIKMVEVQAAPEAVQAPAPPPPAPAASPKDAAAKDSKNMDLAASIGNIFDNVDDEENPLANLIKVLPDVAATELLDDLKEINDIIKDWQKK